MLYRLILWKHHTNSTGNTTTTVMVILVTDSFMYYLFTYCSLLLVLSIHSFFFFWAIVSLPCTTLTNIQMQCYLPSHIKNWVCAICHSGSCTPLLGTSVMGLSCHEDYSLLRQWISMIPTWPGHLTYKTFCFSLTPRLHTKHFASAWHRG